MLVRLLKAPAHFYRGPWPAVGETVEVPDGLGAYMIEHGEVTVIEARILPSIEHVAIGTGKPRGRPRKEVFLPKEELDG